MFLNFIHHFLLLTAHNLQSLLTVLTSASLLVDLCLLPERSGFQSLDLSLVLLAHVSLVLHTMVQVLVVSSQFVNCFYLDVHEVLVVGVNWNQTLGQVQKVMAVEEKLWVTLLHILEQLRQSAPIRHQALDNVNHKFVDLVYWLETEMLLRLMRRFQFWSVIATILDVCYLQSGRHGLSQIILGIVPALSERTPALHLTEESESRFRLRIFYLDACPIQILYIFIIIFIFEVIIWQELRIERYQFVCLAQSLLTVSYHLAVDLDLEHFQLSHLLQRLLAHFASKLLIFYNASGWVRSFQSLLVWRVRWIQVKV